MQFGSWVASQNTRGKEGLQFRSNFTVVVCELRFFHTSVHKGYSIHRVQGDLARVDADADWRSVQRFGQKLALAQGVSGSACAYMSLRPWSE